MQFQVPQFIDVEDKIIGPLTIKQFLYLTGGVGIGYLCIRFIPWIVIGIIPAVGFVALGVALAFYKYNNKPFVFIVEAAFHYFQSSHLYVWHRREKEKNPEVVFNLGMTNFAPTKHSGNLPLGNVGNKLNELTWDINPEKDVTTKKVHSDSAL
jgi:hypothetical protein